VRRSASCAVGGGRARFREAINDDARRGVLAARGTQSNFGLLGQALDLRAVRGEGGDADEAFAAAVRFGELFAQRVNLYALAGDKQHAPRGFVGRGF